VSKLYNWQLQDRLELLEAHQDFADELVRYVSRKYKDGVVDPSSLSSVESSLLRRAGSFGSELRTMVLDAMGMSVDMALEEKAKKLAKEGFLPPSPDAIARIRESVLMDQLKAKFKGANLSTRLRVAANNMKGRFSKDLHGAAGEAKGKDVARNLGRYLTDSRENGVSIAGGSAFKWNERLMVSEQNRAVRDACLKFYDEMGIELVRWTLNPRHPRYDVCDEIAEETGAKALDYVARIDGLKAEGLYHLEEVPDYPHPYCMCDLEPVGLDEFKYGVKNLTELQVRELLEEIGEDFGSELSDEQSKRYYQEWLKLQAELPAGIDTGAPSPAEVRQAKAKIDKALAKFGTGPVKVSSKRLTRYIASGGEKAVNEVYRAVLGKSLDPAIVNKIGIDNALKLLVRQAEKDGKIKVLTEALDRLRSRELSLTMRQSISASRRRLAWAGFVSDSAETGVSKRAAQLLRARNIAEARRELGDALGYSETLKRMADLLTNKSIRMGDVMAVQAGGAKDLDKLAQSLGLSTGQYARVKVDGQNLLIVKQQGMNKMMRDASPDTLLQLSDKLKRIRAGSSNREGWLPAYFKDEIRDKVTDRWVPMKLRDDQQTGIRFVKEAERAFLHFEPGAGKTNTAIGAITELYAEGKVKKALIVVPSNLVRQFDEEVSHFTTLDKKQHMGMGTQGPERRAVLYMQDRLITVISHNQFVRDAEVLKKAGFDMVVVDEVHLMRDKGMELLKQIESRYAVAMTGTAVKNKIADIYDAVDWLKPGTLSSRREFEQKFSQVTRSTSVYEDAMLQELRNLVRPLVLTKESKVPGRLEEIQRTYRLTEQQSSRLLSMEARSAEAVKAGTKSRSQAAAQLMRQASAVINGGRPESNAKFAVMKNIIESNPEERMIVFVSDRRGLNTIRDGLGEEAAYYTGRLSRSQKYEMLESFRIGEGPRVLVLTDAGRTGLNLEKCNHVIMWDTPASYSDYMQRVARAWRGTKTETTFVYSLSSTSKYDDELRERLEDSKKVVQALSKAENLDEIGLAKYLKQALLRRSRR
jgi:superfamily II DNA or RNA helicase